MFRVCLSLDIMCLNLMLDFVLLNFSIVLNSFFASGFVVLKAIFSADC